MQQVFAGQACGRDLAARLLAPVPTSRKAASISRTGHSVQHSGPSLPARRDLKCNVMLITELAGERDDLYTFIFGGVFLTLVTGAAFTVLRQVLLRRELSLAIKALATKARENKATPLELFEFGVMLLEKELYTQANRNFEKAIQLWEDHPGDLAPVYNHLGYSFSKMNQPELAIRNYQKAVELQPGYFAAWQNMGMLYEQRDKYRKAYECYYTALTYRPEAPGCRERVKTLGARLKRLGVRV